MKYLCTITSEIEVLYVPTPQPGEDPFAPQLWVEPDWTAAIAELGTWDGVRSVAITVSPDDARDPYSAGRTYEVALIVHARQFVGEEMWQLYRQECKEQDEPISSENAVYEQVNTDESYDEAIQGVLGPALGKDYMVSSMGGAQVEEAV